jgi:hypothetical protein
MLPGLVSSVNNIFMTLHHLPAFCNLAAAKCHDLSRKVTEIGTENKESNVVGPAFLPVIAEVTALREE